MFEKWKERVYALGQFGGARDEYPHYKSNINQTEYIFTHLTVLGIQTFQFTIVCTEACVDQARDLGVKKNSPNLR